MGSLVVMVGGAMVNALAFSGSNYLFSKLRSDEERRRHDQAMEKLAKAQDEYEKNRIAQLDFINQKLREQGHAAHTFSDVDTAIRQYYAVTGKKISLGPRPTIASFYKPDEQQKMAEIAFIVAGMSIVYVIAKMV